MMKKYLVLLAVLALSSCLKTLDSDDPCIKEAQATNADNRENVEKLAEVYNKSVDDMNDAFDETFKRMVERCEVKAAEQEDREETQDKSEEEE